MEGVNGLRLGVCWDFAQAESIIAEGLAKNWKREPEFSMYTFLANIIRGWRRMEFARKRYMVGPRRNRFWKPI